MTESAYRSVRYGNIDVSYMPDLEGGGMGFGQTYGPVVREMFGKVGRAYEWCAGPGFIGFSLLANGLCDSLCLSDINPDAVAAARDTVRRNNLEDRVSVYLSDSLDQIPAHEKWDLVVSNPPHFVDQYQGSLRHFDAGWQIHRNFYSHVGAHLNARASLLIQENFEGSVAEDFSAMLTDAGLRPLATLMYCGKPMNDFFDSYYFLWSMPADNGDPVDLPSGPSLGYGTGAPAIVAVALAPDGAPEVKLDAFKRYRLDISNRLAADTTLWIYRKKLRLVPRFLRSVCKIGKDQRITTYPFQMFPGRYEIRDSTSRRCLLSLVVE